MALLTLKDVGKIYVSEGNVTVGIRGVDLSFDRGEFVAITGKSGSGKSTLLNVISGMDSYEEGELCIEGQSTSHYLQPEWEEYREKYISFIFQDYNIIDSFTVLQNVELALMHIEDKKERRRRALELIRRVGLTSHIKHKGSKLSGGQKQRTVIARALAKDSPIILADEPTGNLDSATSAEIIKLLHEVSRDKLLIIVTHNFDQVADYATRHVRVFDGAIESDHPVRSAQTLSEDLARHTAAERTKKEIRRKQLRDGLTLGRSIFTSRPKLSVFLCLLLIVGTMGIFLVTALCGGATDILEPNYMFTHVEGRTVITKQSGEVISEDELKALVDELGAKSYLHYDLLLDNGFEQSVTIPTGNDPTEYEYLWAQHTFGEDFGDDIIGRYPQAANEVLLYVPISYRPALGKDALAIEEVTMSGTSLKLTGVKYYYDNNLTPKCLFTEEGFRAATALHYLVHFSEHNIELTVSEKNSNFSRTLKLYNIIPSYDIPDGMIYINSKDYHSTFKSGREYTTSLTFKATYHNYNHYEGYSKAMVFERTYGDSELTDQMPHISEAVRSEYGINESLIISDELLCSLAEDVLATSYTQASLFFENDKAAHGAVEALRAKGYIAVPTDTVHQLDALTAITMMISCMFLAVIWLLAITFIAFFINLCTARTMGAFKGDMAIMRSMGIPVKVIRIGMYVRMMISLIPAFITVVISAVLIFTSPAINESFVYLYPWQYALIFLGMIILVVRTTRKQVRRLFGESVKKALKGGNAE